MDDAARWSGRWSPNLALYRRRVLRPRLLPLLLAAACLLQGGCLERIVADRLVAPTNGGDLRGRVELTAPGFVNGGGTLGVGPPERPATLVYWVVEPGPFAVEVVPDGAARSPLEEAAAASGVPTGQRWVVFRAGHPQLDHDLVLRRPEADAGPQPLGRREAEATVFLLQGWGSRQRTLPYTWHLAGWLANAGCRVVMPDLRAQGDSSGDALTFGHLERFDQVALADHLASRGLLDGPLGVVGHSYGGGVAIQWAAVDPRVRRVVAMSPFADGQTTGDTVRNLLDDTTGPLAWVLKPFLGDAAFRRIGDRIERELGYDLARSSPIASLPRTDTPLLLIHGTADQNVPVSNARRLLAARPTGSEAWFIEGGDHFDYLFRRDEALREKLETWVERLKAADRGAKEAG